jgi:hypothetical protein
MLNVGAVRGMIDTVGLHEQHHLSCRRREIMPFSFAMPSG